MKNYTEKRKDHQHGHILTEKNKVNFRLSRTFLIIFLLKTTMTYFTHSMKISNYHADYRRQHLESYKASFTQLSDSQAESHVRGQAIQESGKMHQKFRTLVE